jgi:choline dehydrogenase-like flavoprotein
MRFIEAEDAASREYDVVIVGGGISGAIMARRLGDAGFQTLVLEAGTGEGATYEGYLGYLDTFHGALIKHPESPYPSNPNAPEPSVLDVNKIVPPTPDTDGLFVQHGPQPYRSTYTRYLGGTSLHWLGTTIRMLPEDFELESRYGVGKDWPISYEDLRPYYAEAERELGVAADVEEQAYLGVTFEPGYVYPMHALPASYSDRQIAASVDGMRIDLGDELRQIRVRGTPVARNSTPNPAYRGGHTYEIHGAVGAPGIGGRCMGNSACVPICPIQAKYNALRTLDRADPDKVAIVRQAVASRVLLDADGNKVTGVEFKVYETPGNPAHKQFTVRGKIVVLATHTVNNAVLLLASGACKSSGMVGRNLMDHPELLTWGSADRSLWPLRGPLATSGIEEMRAGPQRAERASFRMEMGNEGWLWPAGAPDSDVQRLIDKEGLYGEELRTRLRDEVSKQFRFGSLVEQLPDPNNTVTIDPKNWVDALGNPRPILNYTVDDYTRAGFAAAFKASRQIFERANITDASTYSENDPGYFKYEGHDYAFVGAGHFAGSHRMGDDPLTSVVDRRQRTWDHPNLYLVGCGNMVTMGTANPTLTMSALTCWAADNVIEDLRAGVVA